MQTTMSLTGCSRKQTDVTPACDGSQASFISSTLCCELPSTDPTSWEEYDAFINNCRLNPGSNCTLEGYNQFDEDAGTIRSRSEPFKAVRYDCNCEPCSYDEQQACTVNGDLGATCKKLDGETPECVCSDNITGDHCESHNAKYLTWNSQRGRRLNI